MRYGAAVVYRESGAETEGGGTCTCAADVGDEAQVGVLMDRPLKRYGGLDVLVANAGIIHHPAGAVAARVQERCWWRRGR